MQSSSTTEITNFAPGDKLGTGREKYGNPVENARIPRQEPPNPKKEYELTAKHRNCFISAVVACALGVTAMGKS